MNNNDILRRLRYTFDYNDSTMMRMFALVNYPATIEELTAWLKKDDNPEQIEMSDEALANFLNGLIVSNRGLQDGKVPVAEKELNNNIIFRKLKIALSLKDHEIVDILDLADFRFSKHELNAFFRKPDQAQYRECKNQVIRNFLHGLQIKHRPKD